MKITSSNPNLVKFETVKVGEVFQISDQYYMKIQYHQRDQITVNCLNLGNGCTYITYDNQEVTLVPNAELKV